MAYLKKFGLPTALLVLVVVSQFSYLASAANLGQYTTLGDDINSTISNEEAENITSGQSKGSGGTNQRLEPTTTKQFVELTTSAPQANPTSTDQSPESTIREEAPTTTRQTVKITTSTSNVESTTTPQPKKSPTWEEPIEPKVLECIQDLMCFDAYLCLNISFTHIQDIYKEVQLYGMNALIPRDFSVNHIYSTVGNKLQCFGKIMKDFPHSCKSLIDRVLPVYNDKSTTTPANSDNEKSLSEMLEEVSSVFKCVDDERRLVITVVQCVVTNAYGLTIVNACQRVDRVADCVVRNLKREKGCDSMLVQSVHDDIVGIFEFATDFVCGDNQQSSSEESNNEEPVSEESDGFSEEEENRV